MKAETGEDVVRDELAEESFDAGGYNFGFPVRRSMRLGLVEQILAAQGIVQPAPSRQHLIDMIRSGELEGKKVGNLWIVYEDSFQAWVRELSGAA